MLIPISMLLTFGCKGPSAEAAALYERMQTVFRQSGVTQPPAGMARAFFWTERELGTDSVRRGGQRVDTLRPYASFTESRTAVELERSGFGADSAGEPLLLVPDGAALSNPAFAKVYCLNVAPGDKAHPTAIGLAFTRDEHREGRMEIEGTIWFSMPAQLPLEVDFTFPDLPAIRGLDAVGDLEMARKLVKPGGSISFLTDDGETVYVDQWSVRSPVVRTQNYRAKSGKIVPLQRLLVVETGGFLRSSPGRR